jgi:hypothetical protein
MSETNRTSDPGRGTKHQQDRELQDNDFNAVSGGTLRGVLNDRKGGRYLGQTP